MENTIESISQELIELITEAAEIGDPLVDGEVPKELTDLTEMEIINTVADKLVQIVSSKDDIKKALIHMFLIGQAFVDTAKSQEPS